MILRVKTSIIDVVIDCTKSTSRDIPLHQTSRLNRSLHSKASSHNNHPHLKNRGNRRNCHQSLPWHGQGIMQQLAYVEPKQLR